MPLLSDIAQKKKARFFLDAISRDAAILEIGCGNGWVGKYLAQNGCHRYTGLDIMAPADIVGDIRNWRGLGLAPQSFDVIIAFEVIEHVDCLETCFELLKPGGRLMMTSPLPHLDWACRALEMIGLSQQRQTPHSNLIYFKDIDMFNQKHIKIFGFMAQWGIFTR